MWQHALLLPDPKDGWSWATGSLLGLPNLVRVLVTLHRAGIEEVIFPPGSLALYHWLTSCRVRADLPDLTWWDTTGWPDEAVASTLLGVRGGVLVTPQLLRWFYDTLGEAPMGKAFRHAGDHLPVCIAFAPYTLHQHEPHSWTCELLAAQIAAPIVIVPAAITCHTIQELERPGGDRELLSTVGKATDRESTHARSGHPGNGQADGQDDEFPHAPR